MKQTIVRFLSLVSLPSYVYSQQHHYVLTGCFAEGVGSILAGMFGTGSGTTSISQNVGVLAVTKVYTYKKFLWKHQKLLHFNSCSFYDDIPLT